MSGLDDFTDEALAAMILPPAIDTMGRELGMARLSRVLMAAGLKLATDVDGEAQAWEALRGMLDAAVERARRARHPKPKPVA